MDGSGKPEWEELLIHLRDSGRFAIDESDDGDEIVDRGDPTVRRLDLSPDRIDEVVGELERFGLLERTGRGKIRLTSRGLDKADEYRGRSRTTEIERVVDQQTGILLVGLLALYATTVRTLGVSRLATVFVVLVATMVTVVALPARARQAVSDATPTVGLVALRGRLGGFCPLWPSPTSSGRAESGEPSPDDDATGEREQGEDREPEAEDAE